MKTLTPGHELDYLIHERMFTVAVLPYSTDLSAAWFIVEKLRFEGWLISVNPQPNGKWVVNQSKTLNPRGDGTADGWDETWPDTRVLVNSPAFGICLVALRYDLEEEALTPWLIE